MSLTLIEAAKLEKGQTLRRAVIETFAANADILAVLPIDDIPGNSLKYNQEQTLPGIGFRGVNGSFSESTGIINPVVESLAILGGDMDVDTYIVKTMGEGQRAIQESMKVKAAALNFALKFIKGDSATTAKEIDGLQVRLAGDQLIAAGATANGTPLSLAKLDELIDAVDGITHLAMNKTMRRLLSAAARLGTVGGNVNYDLDSFGRRVTKYNDIPILIFDKDNTNAQILPFTEVATSGTDTATSIYGLALGDGMLSGIQNGGIDVRDLGEISGSPVFRTRVEWFLGLVLYHPRAAARLWSISNAAVTV